MSESKVLNSGLENPVENATSSINQEVANVSEGGQTLENQETKAKTAATAVDKESKLKSKWTKWTTLSDKVAKKFAEKVYNQNSAPKVEATVADILCTIGAINASDKNTDFLVVNGNQYFYDKYKFSEPFIDLIVDGEFTINEMQTARDFKDRDQYKCQIGKLLTPGDVDDALDWLDQQFKKTSVRRQVNWHETAAISVTDVQAELKGCVADEEQKTIFYQTMVFDLNKYRPIDEWVKKFVHRYTTREKSNG